MARTALILVLIVTLAALVGCATRPAPAPFVTGDAIGQGSGQDGTHCTWTEKAGKLVARRGDLLLALYSKDSQEFNDDSVGVLQARRRIEVLANADSVRLGMLIALVHRAAGQVEGLTLQLWGPPPPPAACEEARLPALPLPSLARQFSQKATPVHRQVANP